MNPAFSVIFLTTLIGAGQGLFIATVFGAPYAQSGSGSFPVIASGVSLCLLVLGLVASFFHLGRPERAWRAATKWRTSWLSREVIVLPLAMLVVVIYGWLHWRGELSTNESLTWAGWIGVAVMVLLFLCTSMIYACIKFLQEWSSPLTVINFTILGVASGLILAAAIASSVAEPVAQEFLLVGLVATAIAMMTKLFTFLRNSRIKQRSSIQTAIGIKHRHITQRSMGMTGGAFNTRAFFHHCSNRLMANMRGFVLMMVFILPLLLLVLSIQLSEPALVWVVVIIQFVGLIAERWLFFAQANHPQNLYYQTIG